MFKKVSSETASISYGMWSCELECSIRFDHDYVSCRTFSPWSENWTCNSFQDLEFPLLFGPYDAIKKFHRLSLQEHGLHYFRNLISSIMCNGYKWALLMYYCLKGLCINLEDLIMIQIALYCPCQQLDMLAYSHLKRIR